MKRRRPTAEQQRDCMGIAYEDRVLLVTARVDTWPPYLPRVKKDVAGAQRAFHEEFAGKPCWLCGDVADQWEPHELHHLAAGSRGRSHERALMSWLCKACHRNVSRDDLPKLLWAKWRFDHAHCNWWVLTLRHGFHLPELEVPEWCKELV